MRAFTTGLVFVSLLLGAIGRAGATGTVRVQQHDGTVKTYSGVRIRVTNDSMSLTSSDGKGTLVIQKAACTALNGLLRCLPYSVTLDQFGKTASIAMQGGTVWLNPGSASAQLAHSSTQLPTRGVLMSLQTKAGTYVSLTGIIDEVKK